MTVVSRTLPGPPWLGVYPRDVDWSADIPIRPLHSLMEEAVGRYAGRPCIDFLDRKYSFAEIGGLVDRAAKGLRALGVGLGTKVGLFLPNCPYFVVFYHAVLKAGGTVVNYNPLYAERELIHQIEDSETDIMVTLDLTVLYGKLPPLLGRTRLKTIIVCPMAEALSFPKSWLFGLANRGQLADIPEDDRHVGFCRLTENDGRLPSTSVEPERDIALLQYTGGTTGVPKGAMLTHANVYANAVQSALWFAGARAGEERIVGVLPLFHVFAMTAVMNWALRLGAEMVLLPRFDLKRLLRTIHKKRPTVMAGVPTLFNAINTYPKRARYDLSSLRYCISGGAPLPAEVRRGFERLTGARLIEGYGLSECAPVVCCNPLDGSGRDGSIGLPYPQTTVEILSLEPPHPPVPTGDKGEICVSGPQVMAGYWKLPDATAATIVDGRLHTGDIGYMDAEGYVYISDRLKEIINASGYKVYPRVVEEAIHLHPSVSACAVIGVSDPYRGQTVKAFVTLIDGATLTSEALLDFLKDKLSPIEMPKVVEFRAALPMTAVGKIEKKKLAGEEAARAQAPASASPGGGDRA